MSLSTVARFSALLLTCFILVACKTSSERATDHFIAANELLAEDQPRKAIVELRNAIRLNVYHTEARHLLAEVLREQGLTGETFRQYNTLIEQDPNDLKALRALATIALQQGKFGLAEEIAMRGLTIKPDDIKLLATGVALNYRDALLKDQPDVRQAVAREASELRLRLPESRLLTGIVIDDLVRAGDEVRALDEIENALRTDPDNLALHQVNLDILLRRGDYARVEQGLRRMLTRFPENTNIKESLIRYYLSRNEIAEAESFLRAQIIEGERADASRVSLVRFVAEAYGRDAAFEQIASFIDEGTNDQLFRSLRATMNYENGFQKLAIGELEDIVAESEPSDQRREIQVLLGRIMAETGNEIGARAMIEGVLETDPTSVEALKVRATWKIGEDLTDEAIVDLRTALDQAPHDAATMTILARAHLLNGDKELAGEMLALAVQASQSGKEESLRYARFLEAEDKLLPAEAVLLDALRISPRNVKLLSELAGVYVSLEDWLRAEQVERELRQVGSKAALATANDLRLAILRAQDRELELDKFLKDLAQSGASDVAAEFAILQAHIDRGNLRLARNYLEVLLAQRPTDRVLRFLDGALMATQGEHQAALKIYDGLIAEDPSAERIWIEKARSLAALGRTAQMEQAINDGLTSVRNSDALMWMKASLLEASSDYEGALRVYENLYDMNNSNSIIANNLASLLTTLRSDATSLDRAYQIARRLRGSDFPQFQDTYGWIAFRRGDYQEALRHLEPAANALVSDPLVQYHLARTYQALGRNDKALQRYTAAVNLSDDDNRPQFERARLEIEKLSDQ